MSKYTIRYRDEFEAEIEATNLQEAVKKFLSGDVEYKLVGDLWTEYISIFDENGEELKL